MKVRLLVSRCGTNFSQAPGDEIEVPEDEGERMIEAGHCVLVERGKRKAAEIVPTVPTDGTPPGTDAGPASSGEGDGNTPADPPATKGRGRKAPAAEKPAKPRAKKSK